MNDCLIATFDFKKGDIATLVIGRQLPDKTHEIVQIINGNAAVELYCNLSCKRVDDVYRRVQNEQKKN